MLFVVPRWRRSHVVQSRPKVEDQTHRHTIYKKYLPVTHACSEVPVLFHAEDHTVSELEDACGKFKEAEVRFHALLGTDSDNPRRYFQAPLPINFYYFRYLETLTLAERDRSGMAAIEEFPIGGYGNGSIYSITTVGLNIEMILLIHWLEWLHGFYLLSVIEASEPLVVIDGTADEPFSYPYFSRIFFGTVFDLSQNFRTFQDLSFEVSSLTEREAGGGADRRTCRYTHLLTTLRFRRAYCK